LPQSPTEIEIGECAKKAFAVADEEMNGLYQLQILHLEMPESKENLRTAQRAWLRFRDKECYYEFPAASSGGVPGEDFLFCKARLTIERSNYLRYVVTACRSSMECPN
jgi:uncharacterized protein YecT (DUF1311 family)